MARAKGLTDPAAPDRWCPPTGELPSTLGDAALMRQLALLCGNGLSLQVKRERAWALPGGAALADDGLSLQVNSARMDR